MNTALHEISPEEIMALHDGELTADRAKEVAAHLELCDECDALADSFSGTSLSLSSWKVDGPSTALRTLTTLPPSNRESLDFSAFWQRLHNRRTAVALGIGVSAIAFLFMSFETNKDYSSHSVRPDVTVMPLELSEYVSKLPIGANRVAGGGGGGGEGGNRPLARGVAPRFSVSPPAGSHSSESNEIDDERSTAADLILIARTVDLRVVVKKFEDARGGVQAILSHYQGYAANLSVNNADKSARYLNTSLRIPSQHLSAALNDLKMLGYVDSESQTSEEVTGQHTDLVARLKNSRETEIRLQDILRNRTGKVSDVLEVEQEIARVRGEIEQMESELKTLNHRVDFATINLTINEEYKAKVSGSTPAIGIRLHNATIGGFQSAASSALGIILWLIEIMPSLLLWAAIFGFPAWWLWRRTQRAFASAI